MGALVLGGQTPPGSAEAEPAAGEGAPVAAADEQTVRQRTTLNLLGEINAAAGEGRRNENVRLTLIDNNVLKELNVRMGTTATVVTEFRIDQNYFGSEFGGEPRAALHIAPSAVSRLHGNLFWSHNNSIFSARSFFQVGDVEPARTNDYGFTVGTRVWRGGAFTFNGSQRRLRGQVNGNVLAPAADERSALTPDPEDRKIVEAILRAYPAEPPNRTDINPRALNTNAPQDIDNDRAGAVLDQSLGARDRLAMRYDFTLQQVEAFQLVGGQNPDTTTRNHAARLTWTRSWSAATTSDLSAGFDRIGSLLAPEETSLGPFFLFSRELESIGPGGDIPIDRTQNMFRYAARLRQVRGDHALSLGLELRRRQINGFESNEHRGLFSFRPDERGDTMTNLRWGRPSVYMLGLGNVHRGFRDWAMQFYAGDQWRITPSLTFSLGLRYEPATKPVEVNGLSRIPYASDLNNLAPSAGLAWRLPGPWGAIRAAYGLHYGEIFPATYMQARFNPPGNVIVTARHPKLSEPLRGIDVNARNTRSAIYQLAPDLRTPYSHLYSFTWEVGLPREWRLELGYVGSRSHKLLTMWYLNRARAVEGIPLISATVDERRPDPRYFDVHHIHNGSRGYYDAAKVTLRVPRWQGFTVEASYWFSKAIDLGASYTNTASGRDGRQSRGPSEFEFQKEMRGLSDFDQPHAAQWNVNYETPPLTGRARWVRGVFGSWQVSSVILLKAGTPFTVQSGADAPGWGNVDGASGDNPILLDPSILGRSVDHPDTSTQRLPRSAFATIRPGELRGNLGRNTFRKDGVANVNFGLSRRWSLSGDKTLLWRAESLNLLNHPQFAEPGEGLAGDNFGVITNTLNDGRTFRFTLQFSF